LILINRLIDGDDGDDDDDDSDDSSGEGDGEGDDNGDADVSAADDFFKHHSLLKKQNVVLNELFCRFKSFT